MQAVGKSLISMGMAGATGCGVATRDIDLIRKSRPCGSLSILVLPEVGAILTRKILNSILKPPDMVHTKLSCYTNIIRLPISLNLSPYTAKGERNPTLLP